MEFECEFCGEIVDIEDTDIHKTVDQWRCRCGGWNDREDVEEDEDGD